MFKGGMKKMKAAAVDEDTGVTQEPLEARKQDRSNKLTLRSPPYLSLTVGSNKEKEKQENPKG